MVGLERTFYNVSENVGVVEVCAIVISPSGNVPCPIDFPFDVNLSTNNDSAGVNIELVAFTCKRVIILFLRLQLLPWIMVLWTLSCHLLNVR